MSKNLNKEEPFDIKRANPSHSRSYSKKPSSGLKDVPEEHRQVVMRVSASLTELALVGFLAVAGAGFYLARKRGFKWG